jgi:hypothetical protein
MRNRVPSKLSLRVLYECAYTCCICRNRRRPVQVHHIDKNPRNNVEENLVALCSICHGEAHTKHDLSQNLSAGKIKKYKRRWIADVAKRSSKAMLPSANADQAVWTYINHERLYQFIERAGCQFDQEWFAELKARGVIDSLGMPQPVVQPSAHKHTWTVYDRLPYYDRHQVHRLHTKTIDEFIRTVHPIDLDEIWRKSLIKSLVSSGTICFCIRAFYFKQEQHYPEEKVADRLAYAQARGIKVQFRISTRNMFGTSAIADSFSGHKVAAALFAVKSVNQEERKLVIYGTPLALGAGFINHRSNCPYTHAAHVGYDD